MTTEKLYWHCARCGGHEDAQSEYEHGDTEPCVCGDGVAEVMTLREAAAVEQRRALGLIPPTPYTPIEEPAPYRAEGGE